jgi:aminoglycoside phosphotransferase (APT) family kinase protein
VLESVARRGEAIEHLWACVEELCEPMPRTLVHGDFRPKNARVRAAAQGTLLYPLDWEMAGWGVPAVDLAPSRFGAAGCAVDLDVYRSVAGEAWPELDVAAVQAMEDVGRLFRVLDAVGWASATLARSPEKSLIWLRACEPALAEAMRGLA